MNVMKEGGQRLFQKDVETGRRVAEKLDALRCRGLHSVREFSRRCDDAIALFSDHALEHLELYVANADYSLQRLRNDGSLFIGEESAVAYDNKSIGTNDILPTNRSAPLYRRRLGGKIAQDRHASLHAACGQHRGGRRHRATVRCRAHARTRHHGARADGPLRMK